MTERQVKKQLFHYLSRAMLCVMLITQSLVLTGCGKKPGSVDAPPEVTHDTFPQIYPDPATDPKP